MRRGVLAPRDQRALMLGASVLIAALPIAISHVSGAVVAWPIALVLALLVFIRIAGRTTDEWATAAVSYASLRTRNRHKFRHKYNKLLLIRIMLPQRP